MKIPGMLFVCFLLCSYLVIAQKQYRLTPPLAKFESLFFDQATAIEFAFRQQGAVIRYTTDGSEPTATSAVYEKPVMVNEHATTIKAKAFASGYNASETISYRFFQKGQRYIVKSHTAPAQQYAGKGTAILHNSKSGSSNFSDGEWLGYDSDSVVLDIWLQQPTPINEIMVHALRHQGAWIFLPEKIKVYTNELNRQQLVMETSYPVEKDAAFGSFPLVIKPNIAASQLRIVLYPLNPIPEWHQGRGTKAWLFLDELIVY